jgi:Tol biopolymer transport system component
VTILAIVFIISLSFTASSAQKPIDIFIGSTDRVSVASDGTQGNGNSGYFDPGNYVSNHSISADGRYVAFESLATNLVIGDTNASADIFVHDWVTGETNRVSVASDGTQANNHSFFPSLSDDGRYVAFNSFASNLITGDTNGWGDIFVHDRLTGETTIASVASEGAQANNNTDYLAISGNGRYVVFQSYASNLVEGDTNGTSDFFVHDRVTSLTTRISVASDGTQANGASNLWPSVSDDGRYIAFISEASNLVVGDNNYYCDTDHDGIYNDNCPDIFVHDQITGETWRVSVSSDGTEGNGWSWFPSISADGHYVAFSSNSSNLVAGDTNNFCDWNYDGILENCFDGFVHDLVTGQTTRISVSSSGTQSNGASGDVSISANGNYVFFYLQCF